MTTYQADNVVAPFTDGSAVSNVRLFDSTTGSQAHALPADWAGKYVRILPLTEDVWVLFSKNAAATVDRTVAATAAGASNTALGTKLLKDQYHDYRLPGKADSETLYFVREAGATGSVQIQLASD